MPDPQRIANRHASLRLAKMAKSRAQTRWGKAFALFGSQLRQACIAAEYVSIIASQEAEPGTQAARIIEGATEVARF